ncbi:MAG: DNA cytosine methyltransferase [Candidatus Dadabacteria bacterium]|nr:DNA cytosine methyltransferase [Candidatus Dadabacteria bacterium]
MKKSTSFDDTVMEDRFSVVSLFTGCGGLDLGFVGGFTFLGQKYEKRRFKIIWANDIDKSSCKTFRSYFSHNIVNADTASFKCPDLS